MPDKKRIALITGASSGLGREFARLLAREAVDAVSYTHLYFYIKKERNGLFLVVFMKESSLYISIIIV